MAPAVKLLNPVITSIVGLACWVTTVFVALEYLKASPRGVRSGELDAKSISFVHRLCCTIFATALLIDLFGLVTSKAAGKWKMSLLICSVNMVALCTYGGITSGFFPTMTKYNGHRLEVLAHIEWCYTTPSFIVLLSLYCGHLAPPRIDVLSYVFWDVFMIVTGFAAAYYDAPFNYLPFFLSCLGFWYTLKGILDLFKRATEAAEDERTRTKMFVLKTNTVVMWSVFPLIWLLSDFGFLRSDTEASLFALADVMAKALWSISVVTEDKYNGGVLRAPHRE